MINQKPTISLGFTGERFQPGVHICQIISDDEEREDALLRFLQSGLDGGERTSCFTNKVSSSTIRQHLSCHGISYEDRCSCGDLSMMDPSSVYFTNDCFDPDRMLGILTKYHEDSVKNGYPAARVIGEMSPEIQQVEGGSRLLEYESRVTMLQRERPVSCVCQYDARLFDGATIMDVLKVHPLMVIRGAVVRNPFYVPPEEFLAR